MSTARDEAAILNAVDKEVAAMAQGDMEAFEYALSPDATLMPPSLEPKTGEDLRTWVRSFLQDFSVEWLSFEHGESGAEGSLGFRSAGFPSPRSRFGAASGSDELVHRTSGPVPGTYRTRGRPTRRRYERF
jgi:hypothetical protein